MAFQGRVQDLASAPDGRERLEKEGRFVKRKIEELQTEVRQAEENMGKFSFKSASGEAMKQEMEKKIDRMRQEIERLKAQHKQLMIEMRAPQPAEAVAGPNDGAGA
jgi:chromosome segregation ATPase